MKIEVYKKSDNQINKNLNLDDFMNYLACAVLTMENTEVQELHKTLQDTKLSLTESKRKMDIVKMKIDSMSKEYAREKALSRVLSLISLLKREGRLTAQNRIKVVQILETIHSLEFDSLRAIEQKLSILLPATYQS